MHCDMLKIQDGGAIVEKVNWGGGGTYSYIRVLPN